MPEFLHVLFNFVLKHSPLFFLDEMLLFRFVALIVHALIVQTSPKTTGECFTKAHANIQALLSDKKIHPKKSLRSVLH